ncbi:hypothetical protein [Mesorhizobium sp. M3A.F.Ca.ET.080.04.2.1]|uniref:hypothetical protein n=1 Tax=Mesorhizobium sp. M3A.F.Ca.ET.080.04.2.1 TaxID=2493676 RepID=UPI0013ED003F|nr:hypothetical protein [Mesorhizobium sp. M3A.F.Ca.ET.080.04.2.1]
MIRAQDGERLVWCIRRAARQSGRPPAEKSSGRANGSIQAGKVLLHAAQKSAAVLRNGMDENKDLCMSRKSAQRFCGTAWMKTKTYACRAKVRSGFAKTTCMKTKT